MFDPLLRVPKDRILRPLALRLGGISPNVLTLASLVVGIAAAVAGWRGAFGSGLALWLVNRILDGLDGVVARIHGKASDLGGFLDLVADFTVYAAVPVALALRPGAQDGATAAALVLLGTFYVNAAAWMVPAALLEKRALRPDGTSTSLTMPEGLISGSETVVFYALFFLFPGHLVLLFHLMAALTALTVLQRVLWAIRIFPRTPLPAPTEQDSPPH